MNLKNKLIKLYNESQAEIVVYEKEEPTNFFDAMVKYSMIFYWRGRRDAYYLLLKGKEGNEES